MTRCADPSPGRRGFEFQRLCKMFDDLDKWSGESGVGSEDRDSISPLRRRRADEPDTSRRQPFN